MQRNLICRVQFVLHWTNENYIDRYEQKYSTVAERVRKIAGSVNRTTVTDVP